ncbi:glycoside hydrolase family 88 protein [Microvirga makkahensis]
MNAPSSSHIYNEPLSILCKKLEEDERTIGTAFPYVTAPDGRWMLMSSSVSAVNHGENWDHGNWFCGFWVGLLLAAYLHSGDEKFVSFARDRMALVAQCADDGNTHDIGFIFLSSAVPFYHITGERLYRDMAMRAAERLRARLVVTRRGSYISSWGPMDDPRGRESSAIDTMANIPLLYWAARESGDASFQLAAVSHARMTDRSFTRPDQTLYHAVQYDTVSGVRLRGYTFQGYSDEPSWSRGTGWAVYGLAATAAATGDRAYLDRASSLAKKWLEQLGGCIVPPWDFDDPAPRPVLDSSASAMMAAVLVDLAHLHPEEDQRIFWRGEAERLPSGLCSEFLATDQAHRGILKKACYSKPHNVGVESAVMFGDYFFEAIMRLLMPGKFIRQYERLG